MTLHHDVANALRERRQAIGLSQSELARRAGISRQALSALETAQAVPSAPVLLRLARELATRVESLFWLRDDPERAVHAQLAGCAPPGPPPDDQARRVVLAWLAGRWVAHPLTPAHLDAADGLATAQPEAPRQARVELLDGVDLEALRTGHVLALGCDPAMGLLASRVRAREPDVRLTWLHMPSRAALRALDEGLAHIAGLHLFDEPSGEFNVPFVQRTLGAALVVNLARWDAGLALAPGNPCGVHSVADLARPGLRLINRPSGAGARELLERALRAHAIAPDSLADWPGRLAPGHDDVTRAIALGVADVGVATRASAIAHGLDFLPLATERFDLVVPRALSTLPAVQRVLDTADSPAFRRELASLAGYETAQTGHVVAELA